MKTRIVFYIFSLLFFSTVAGSVVEHNEAPIGNVIALEGTVFIRSSSGRIDTLRMHQPVYADDEVTATGGSRTTIRLKDKGNTEVVIGDAGNDTIMRLDTFVYADRKSDPNSPWIPLKGAVRSAGDLPGKKRMFPTNLPAHTSGIRG